MDAIDTARFVWCIEAGETEGLTIPVLDGGSPLDITGWTVDAQIKRKPGGTAVYTFTPDLISTANSAVKLRLPPAASVGWTFTTAWFRVKLIDPTSPPSDPTIYRILQGPVVINPD